MRIAIQSNKGTTLRSSRTVYLIGERGAGPTWSPAAEQSRPRRHEDRHSRPSAAGRVAQDRSRRRGAAVAGVSSLGGPARRTGAAWAGRHSPADSATAPPGPVRRPASRGPARRSAYSGRARSQPVGGGGPARRCRNAAGGRPMTWTGCLAGRPPTPTWPSGTGGAARLGAAGMRRSAHTGNGKMV